MCASTKNLEGSEDPRRPGARPRHLRESSPRLPSHRAGHHRRHRELDSSPAIPKPGYFNNFPVLLYEDSAAAALLTPDFQIPEGFQGRSPWLALAPGSELL